MPHYEFRLAISPEQYLAYYYKGTIKQVIVTCDNGQRLQFPAALLRQFVSQHGIQGNFELQCDEQGRNATLIRRR
ncbi:MAG: hypothetical protein CGU28_01605 [Candidatus Dactylopiibacterium carminicum]|nr:MAG: hypothetical protein CGU28_01605 [Candidatus Dactylopiibacterium carminicum]